MQKEANNALSNPFRQFRIQKQTLANNVCEPKHISFKSQSNGFVEDKIINTNLYHDSPQNNWTSKLSQPGYNVHALHYIPKNAYKFPEHNQYSLQLPKITNDSPTIVPLHRNVDYPNNLLDTHGQQQPLFYNYNNLATNQPQFNDNKLQKINFTPLMLENNKKMKNNQSNELVAVSSQQKFSLHQKDCVIDNNPSLYKTPVSYTMSNNYTEQSNVASNQFELTTEQLRELNEEPLNTANAMVAVMGYNPKDDKRICKFYNPNTNECFKGAHCKYEHVQKNKGNFSFLYRILLLLQRCQDLQ